MRQLFRLATVSTTITLLAIALPKASSRSAIAPSFPFNTQAIPKAYRQAHIPTIAQIIDVVQTEPFLLAQASAVPINGATDAVTKFNTSQQLYIQGNPLTAEQINRLLTTLNANPNVFVVVMDYSANVFDDDETLSKGIGNSAAFEGVVSEVTGERQGILLMVYFESDQGRKIFMRSEELPDRLGVGETNFADEDGNPKELLNVFINATRNEGKDLPGALEVLINRINGTIREQMANNVSQAQQSIEQAATALAGFPVALGQFQSRFQVGGAIGSPNVAVWDVQLDDARKALANNNFTKAQTLAQKIVQQIRQQEESMSRYGQAPDIAAQVQQTLTEGAIALNTLPDSPQKQQASLFLTQGQTQFQEFQTQYQAGQIEFWTSLQAAQTSSQSLMTELDQAQAAIRQAQLVRLVILLVISSVVIVVAIALFINARNARIDAQKVFRQAKQKIADRTKALFQLMEDAEYHSFKTYTGHTEHHAYTMLNHITDAITLAGGTDVVLAEVDRLIHSGHLTSRFFTGHYKRAIALLTDEKTALPLEKVKSIEAVLKNQETVMTDLWRSHLSTQQNAQEGPQQADAPDARHSFQNILDLMTEHRQHAVTLLDELIQKDSGIADYFHQIETHAHTTQTLAQALQTLPTPQTLQTPQASSSAPNFNHWFKVPTVLSTLLPLITASGGYLAKGRQSMETDPIMAWDHYADGGDRIAQDARQMIDLGTHARTDLLQTLAHADYRLHPHRVTTDWAHRLTQDYSQKLEQLAKDAVQHSVAEAITTLNQAIDELGDRLQTIVRQDEDRRTTAVQHIKEAETDVANHRQSLCQALKSLDFFQTGQPDQVLREPHTDPSVSIANAKQHWQALQDSLNQGNVEESQSHLDQIEADTEQAHQWVGNTQAAVESYSTTLQAHKTHISDLQRDCQTRYIPILQTIQRQYAPTVLEQIASEVNAGQTIADNANHAQNLITKATENLKTAASQMNTAHILTAQATLEAAARVLSGAQTQLTSIEQARQILSQRQETVVREYETLRDRCAQTQRDMQASYVRSTTQQQWDEVHDHLHRLTDSVDRVPLNPYAASANLQDAEQVRQRLEDAIATDKRTFEQAKATIRRAEAAIQSAENDIHSASHRHFRYATVSTTSARSMVKDAERDLERSRRLLQSQHYETSTDQAQSAINEAQQASREADLAISKARRAHDAEQRRRNQASVSHVSSTHSSHRSSSSSRRSSSRSRPSSSSSRSSSRKSSSGSRGGSW